MHAYIEVDIEDQKQALDLKAVDSGSNVVLLKPYVRGVFYQSCDYDIIPVVSGVQLYLDLAGNKERGEEAANFLYERIIKQEWTANQPTETAK